MALIQRKGVKGAAANYITRTRAVRKLQVSLADFRKLCILKGIYPRVPKSKKKAASPGVTKAKYRDGAGKGTRGANANNTFYYVKDIQFLSHEPVLQKLRERHAFEKKILKAVARRDYRGADILESNEPVYTLDHLVKERYPTFNDALMDLDDCLCHVFLFATLPTDYASPDGSQLTSKSKIESCQRLCNEFLTYVIRSNALEKVFCSIKGYYYRCKINGAQITWLVPHQFTYTSQTAELKNSSTGMVGGVNGGTGVVDVDMRVMLTFLEFYECMLGFVNFRLLTSIGLTYPPPASVLKWIEDETEEMNVDSVSAKSDSTGLGKQSKEIKQKLRSLRQKLEQITETGAQDVTADENVEVDISEQEVQPTLTQLVFSGLTIKLNREVPRHALQFMLLAHGAKVILPSYSSQQVQNDLVTHEICDRPLEHISMKADRKYVQPQWVFDCINSGKCILEDLYAIGTKLLPHVSPFMDYAQEEEQEDAAEVEESDGEIETAAKPTKLTQQQREMAKMMMSNKKRKFLERIEKSRMHQSEAADKIAAKRALLKKNQPTMKL